MVGHSIVVGDQIALSNARFRKIDFVQIREVQRPPVDFQPQTFGFAFGNFLGFARGGGRVWFGGLRRIWCRRGFAMGDLSRARRAERAVFR